MFVFFFFFFFFFFLLIRFVACIGTRHYHSSSRPLPLLDGSAAEVARTIGEQDNLRLREIR
jgi:hypothetical protein